MNSLPPKVKISCQVRALTMTQWLPPASGVDPRVGVMARAPLLEEEPPLEGEVEAGGGAAAGAGARAAQNQYLRAVPSPAQKLKSPLMATAVAELQDPKMRDLKLVQIPLLQGGVQAGAGVEALGGESEEEVGAGVEAEAGAGLTPASAFLQEP